MHAAERCNSHWKVIEKLTTGTDSLRAGTCSHTFLNFHAVSHTHGSVRARGDACVSGAHAIQNTLFTARLSQLIQLDIT